MVQEKDAYKGLQQLIEMTIVEILTWKKGTFTLDVLPESVADGYRYFPEKMNREINVDTQGILMNSLRIFDEKMRDGELQEEDYTEDAVSPQGAAAGEESPLLSADDLGLADLDQLEKKTPRIYSVLEECDPCEIHRRNLDKIVPPLSLQERESLVSFLGKFSAAANKDEGTVHRGVAAQSILFFSYDELFKYSLTTVCKHAGILVFATNEEQDLDHIIDRSLANNSLPVLVFDSPENADGEFSADQIASLRRQKKDKYPQICVIQLVSPDAAAFALQSYNDGVRAVLPRPSREEGNDGFVADTVQFLLIFQSYLLRYTEERKDSFAGILSKTIMALRGLMEAPEVALALLQFVAAIFERSITLIVRESELVAEKGIGVKAEKSKGATPAMGFRIPLGKPSLLRNVIEEGCMFYGITNDAVVREYLFAAIGAPSRSSILLLPLKLRGKTISLTYADFGSKEPTVIELDLLGILARQAELVLENSMYRKKLEKPLVKG